MRLYSGRDFVEEKVYGKYEERGKFSSRHVVLS